MGCGASRSNARNVADRNKNYPQPPGEGGPVLVRNPSYRRAKPPPPPVVLSVVSYPVEVLPLPQLHELPHVLLISRRSGPMRPFTKFREKRTRLYFTPPATGARVYGETCAPAAVAMRDLRRLQQQWGIVKQAKNMHVDPSTLPLQPAPRLFVFYSWEVRPVCIVPLPQSSTPANMKEIARLVIGAGVVPNHKTLRLRLQRRQRKAFRDLFQYKYGDIVVLIMLDEPSMVHFITLSAMWITASTDGDLVQLQLLRSKEPVIPRAIDCFGRTALHISVQNPTIMAEMIRQESMLDATDHSSRTALHYAVRDGSLELVSLLVDVAPVSLGDVVKANAFIAHRDNDGFTAMMHAALMGKRALSRGRHRIAATYRKIVEKLMTRPVDLMQTVRRIPIATFHCVISLYRTLMDAVQENDTDRLQEIIVAVRRRNASAEKCITHGFTFVDGCSNVLASLELKRPFLCGLLYACTGQFSCAES